MNILSRTTFLIATALASGTHAADFESEFISVKTRGTGPDVVLLHGFACSSDVWDGVAGKLDSKYTLHVVQVAGFAGSPPPAQPPEKWLDTIRDELLRYIDSQKLDEPILIGHSMGGFTSVRAAAKNPEAIGKVIVVDSLPLFSLIFDPSATSESIAPFAKLAEITALAMDDAQFQEQARQSITILTKQADKRDLLLEWSKASDRKAYAQISRELMTLDARPELHKVTCPVTVIHMFDEAANVPEDEVRQLYTDAYENLKGVRIHGIGDSFHFIMWDQPERFCEMLEKELSTPGR